SVPISAAATQLTFQNAEPEESAGRTGLSAGDCQSWRSPIPATTIPISSSAARAAVKSALPAYGVPDRKNPEFFAGRANANERNWDAYIKTSPLRSATVLPL